MIRRSPCELYIKYLLVHPDDYDITQVRNIVRSHQLDWPNDEYGTRLLARMRVPDPFRPTNRLHGRSFRFILREGLLGFFHPDKDDLRAHKLLEQGRAKEIIETLLIGNEELAFIARYLKSQGIKASTEAVRRYRTYYWDLSKVDSHELKALLRMRTDYLFHPSDGREPTPDEKLQRKALDDTKYRDPRRLAAEMPITPIAALRNRTRLGFMPGQVELSRLAMATRVGAVSAAMDSTQEGSPTAAAKGRDYAIIAEKMTGLIQELGSPDVELQKELQQLALQTEKAELPHIAELSDGRHTVDMNPVIEAEFTEVEDGNPK